MGIFSNSSSPFDQIVEKVTDEKSQEDWGLIMEVCDRVQATNTGPKDCLKAIYKRLNHQDPHVVLQAIILLDACVNNCGQYFLMEVASREFETEFRKLLQKSHPKVEEKLKLSLKRWAEGEFSKDSKYSLIPTLYNALKREGYRFGGEEGVPRTQQLPKDPNVVSSKQEEDDIAKAIQMSLESSSKNGSKGASSSGNLAGGNTAANSSLYPSANAIYSTPGAVNIGASGGFSGGTVAAEKDQKKARCLYDFEAAEDNELTFKTGEMVVILDDQDANWWKGSNHRGEGLFPANFVTMDLLTGAERKKSVQFNEEVEVKPIEKEVFAPQLTVDEDKIDQLLSILHEADPLDEDDPASLPVLEEQVGVMGPLIDTELEKIDRQHAKLTRLSRELVESLQLYHTLMAEMPPSLPPPAMSYPGAGYSMGQPGFMPGPGMPGMPMPGMPGMPPVSMPGMIPMNMAGIPGMPGSSLPGMPGSGMPGGGMLGGPGPGMPPGQDPGNMQAPGGLQPGPGMYYMDPNLQGAGGYLPGLPQAGGYLGSSAPPPTPPLYDPGAQQQAAYSTQQQ